MERSKLEKELEQVSENIERTKNLYNQLLGQKVLLEKLLNEKEEKK